MIIDIPQLIAIVAVLSTLIGSMIGAVATYFSARNTWRNLHFNEAATQYISAFTNKLIALRNSSDDVFKILTPSVFASHERATIIFEPNLTECQRKKLHVALTNYKSLAQTRSPGSIKNRIDDCKNALALIDKLLVFARHR
jgi:hypothetical protein